MRIFEVEIFNQMEKGDCTTCDFKIKHKYQENICSILVLRIASNAVS